MRHSLLVVLSDTHYSKALPYELDWVYKNIQSNKLTCESIKYVVTESDCKPHMILGMFGCCYSIHYCF